MAEASKKQSNKKPVAVGYHLFLYREQLRRRNVKEIKLVKAKYQLTNDLVVITWNNPLTSYSKEERGHFVDTVLYKKKLKQQIDSKNKSKKTKSSKANE